jgi:hypothetical protein
MKAAHGLIWPDAHQSSAHVNGSTLVAECKQWIDRLSGKPGARWRGGST